MKSCHDYESLGATLRITRPERRCLIIPKWCGHIHKEITRAEAVQCLRQLRNGRAKLRRTLRKYN